jgi:predicted porin
MKLKKLTLAAAVAAAASAPVMAQTSVTIYGKLYPYLLNESGSHASAAGTPVSTLSVPATGTRGTERVTGLASANSRLGFRGTEDLGGGMKANFQLEGVAAVDSGGGPFQFGRNTFVELAGGFGSVKLGNHDTVFKEYGDTIGVLGLSSGSFMSSSGILRKPGFGTSGSSSFHLRRPNSIIYTTPEFNNIEASFQYSTDEVVGGPRKPRVASMGVRWDNEVFYVALAHEIHHDLFGGSNNAPAALRNNAITDRTHAKDQATEFVVEWRPNKTHKIEFDAVRKQYKESATVAGRFSSYRNMAYLVNWEARWTPQWRTDAYVVRSTAGTCARVAATCTTDGLEGTKYTAAVGYSLSKRTMLFAAASLIKNGKSARYSNVELSGNPNPGEDVRQLAVGVSHNF